MGGLQAAIVTTLTAVIISALFTSANRKGKNGTPELFLVRFSAGVIVIGIVCMLLFGVFLFFSVSVADSFSKDERLLVFGGFTFFYLLGAILALAAARWQLYVDLGRIEYTPVFGRTQIIKPSDIAYVVVGMNIKAYDHWHRKIFTVDPTCKGKESLLSWFTRYGVPFGRDVSVFGVIAFRLHNLFQYRKKEYLTKEKQEKMEQGRQRRLWYTESPPDLPDNMEELLRPLLRQSIGLIAGDAAAHCVVGRSKFGGEPDLPPDFQWDYYEGRAPEFYADGSYKEVEKSRPLVFLLQVNCQEVKALYPQSPLPAQGLLSFFYEMDSMLWGPEPLSRAKYVKVYYFQSVEGLICTRMPLEIDPKYHIVQRPIILHKEYSLPPFNEFVADKEYSRNLANYKLYDQYRASMGVEYSGHGELAMDSRLFGWPESIQNSVFDEFLEEYLKEMNHQPSASQASGYTDLLKEWELLLQLDSGTFDEMGAHSIMFGDYGNLYFAIRKEDLAAKRFDRTWFTLQCT